MPLVLEAVGGFEQSVLVGLRLTRGYCPGDALAPETKLGQYEVVEAIGAGGEWTPHAGSIRSLFLNPSYRAYNEASMLLFINAVLIGPAHLPIPGVE